MKVSAAQYIAVFWKNEWVIGHGIQLAFKYVLTIRQSIAYGPKNLGSAAQCIRVLHPGAVLMTGINLAVADHFSQVGCTDLLTILSTSPVNTRIQRNVTAHQSLDAHRTGNLCRF